MSSKQKIETQFSGKELDALQQADQQVVTINKSPDRFFSVLLFHDKRDA